jgi:hypothetical protein
VRVELCLRDQVIGLRVGLGKKTWPRDSSVFLQGQDAKIAAISFMAALAAYRDRTNGEKDLAVEPFSRK